MRNILVFSSLLILFTPVLSQAANVCFQCATHGNQYDWSGCGRTERAAIKESQYYCRMYEKKNFCVKTDCWQRDCECDGSVSGPGPTPGPTPVPGYCDFHPTAPACESGGYFCREHPSDPACRYPGYCESHPTEPSCRP